MDIMEHRVPYRNDAFITGIVLLLLTLIWINIQAKDDKQLWVVTGDSHLTQIQGICYYKSVPLTGCVYERYANGDFARQIPYINGLQDGMMRYWYPNQSLQQERFFASGKKQGIHKSWWPDGSPRFEYTFKDDEYNGTVKEWYAGGKLCKVFHYKMGHEDGLQQMWWDNGTVRANYVVKNGQQYGLIGRKLCRNTVQ
ncbi:MAG: toxin-antitoxin system YwqK family antitoxin [Bacteroidota bacterium]